MRPTAREIHLAATARSSAVAEARPSGRDTVSRRSGLSIDGRTSRDTASMIRFRFELYPLDEVSPWGRDQPRLHWFGLTEGWYWLEAGGQELLRRTEATRHPETRLPGQKRRTRHSTPPPVLRAEQWTMADWVRQPRFTLVSGGGAGPAEGGPSRSAEAFGARFRS
ncbi:DUF5984 family protein [Micromonospora sp. WMMA1949]|uniref:DUF5984 family protein n=1 Tax=Micromonospora sp. WMMA1949 TaxID=3015162 RepID=UPI003FA5587F